MANEIVLYDLPSKGEPHCFSFNAWKGRLFAEHCIVCYDNADKLSIDQARSVLNYKKIPYTTEWVEYPDLEPTLKALYAFISLNRSLRNPTNTATTSPVASPLTTRAHHGRPTAPPPSASQTDPSS